jgi:YbgC/YbaW family acyl-CoA thioester hydrolase
MQAKIHTYNKLIKEYLLDTFGHVNHAMYLVILEEARWDLLTAGGYGMQRIMDSKIGPTILEFNIKFLRELKLRDEIVIETQLISCEKKIMIVGQRILRDGEVCCTAELTLALFDLNQRKIILPTEDWLTVLGVTN